MRREILILTIFLGLAVNAIKHVSAETHCTTDGWFGTNCMYQCHCADSAPCDKVDGSCSKGCHRDWFGTACQYKSIRLKGDDRRLLDKNDKTCATVKNLIPDLTQPIPLTWFRLVGTQAEDLKRMRFSYYVDDEGTFECTSGRFAKVNNRTLDVECITNKTVTVLIIKFQSPTNVCSIYVSGGRNLALKQSTKQSSTFQGEKEEWIASNAVDGQTGHTGRSGHMINVRKTCTHTGYSQSGEAWWTVTFSRAAYISSFLIYNRDEDCCRPRLWNFDLTASSEKEEHGKASIRTYTDKKKSPQAIYSWVPSPRIKFPVKEVRITIGPRSQFLTLCEVFAFGETQCPANTFGLDCQGTCHCAQNKSCFVHSGGCPSGCAPGYIGEDCQKECRETTWGQNCTQSCNMTCQNNTCHHVTGMCDECLPGFLGDFCDQASSKESGEPGSIMWGIAAAIGLAVAGVIIGIFVSRCSFSR